MKISKAVVLFVLLLPSSAFSSQAPASKELKADTFLECAATFSYYTYLLKAIDYSNKQEIGALEEKIAFYLGVAMKISPSDTTPEYKRKLSSEQNESEKIIKTKGVNEYLRYTEERINKCGEYTHKNKDRIYKILSGKS